MASILMLVSLFFLELHSGEHFICRRDNSNNFIKKYLCLERCVIEMFSHTVWENTVLHVFSCLLTYACVCAYFINKVRLDYIYTEGWPQFGIYGKGCTASNSSRHVGVFNGEWSNLRFLMMIRGGNWLRFTVSLTTETEEGENRIKASKLSVCAYLCVRVCLCAGVRQRKRPVTCDWPPSHTHPPTHFHTSTSRGNVSLKPTAAQLTEPNESGLNFTLSCSSLWHTHSHSVLHTHTHTHT